MWSIWNIAKREFKSSFISPVAYVVICLSLVLLGLAVPRLWKTEQVRRPAAEFSVS